MVLKSCRGTDTAAGNDGDGAGQHADGDAADFGDGGRGRAVQGRLALLGQASSAIWQVSAPIISNFPSIHIVLFFVSSGAVIG